MSRKMGIKKLTSGAGEMGQSLRVLVAIQGTKVHLPVPVLRNSLLLVILAPRDQTPSSVFPGHLRTHTHKLK